MGAMTTEEAYLYENIAKQVQPLRQEVAQLKAMIAELKATGSRAPSGQTEFTGRVEKPPLGLRPRWIAHEMRATEITDAMRRYWQAKKTVPKEWFDELQALVG